MKKISIYLIMFIALLVSIYYGAQKSGFHEDEYYTYFSTNRSLGLYQPDREWQDRQTILDEFVVKEGEGFNYGLVKLVQSWDVHPPFYYFVFHTICSFVPGVFTKWTGIITNLIAFVISIFALYALMEKLKVPFQIQILTLIFWGLNPQTISCNMLIRMYAFLTAAVFSCAYLHVRLIQDYDKYRKDIKSFMLKWLLPIMAISYVGFLIQYFYIFFFVSIGVATAYWLFFKNADLKYALVYVSGCAVSLLLAVLTYPASVRHMFGGYRGSDASGSFFDLFNTGLRIKFFVGLLNDYVFAGGLIFIALFIAILIVAGIFTGKKYKLLRPEVMILTVGTVGYFLLTAKTALLVGSASNRYEMPIYGLMIMLLFWDVYYTVSSIGQKSYVYAFMVAMVAFLIKGLVIDGNVLFLYKEDVPKIAYAKEHSDNVAVVMYNPATPHNVWRLTDELLQYDKVFYMNEENTEKLVEKEVTSADKIVLYVADDDLQQEAINNLVDSCQNISGKSFVSDEEMWVTYELD
ncbi:MAG: hypothetical protein K5792_01995 [Butyrivibrio sp.]|nr:hypothetical protein [Butyrivibrio sp.]